MVRTRKYDRALCLPLGREGGEGKAKEVELFQEEEDQEIRKTPWGQKKSKNLKGLLKKGENIRSPTSGQKKGKTRGGKPRI